MTQRTRLKVEPVALARSLRRARLGVAAAVALVLVGSCSRSKETTFATTGAELRCRYHVDAESLWPEARRAFDEAGWPVELVEYIGFVEEAGAVTEVRVEGADPAHLRAAFQKDGRPLHVGLHAVAHLPGDRALTLQVRQLEGGQSELVLGFPYLVGEHAGGKEPSPFEKAIQEVGPIDKAIRARLEGASTAR